MIILRADMSPMLKKISALEKKQLPFAASRALNDAAKEVEKQATDQLRQRLDRPTAYALRAIKVLEWSNKNKLHAVIGLRTDNPGKGTPWNKAFAHLFKGGDRRWKRFEGALRRRGIIPPGMAAVVPRASSWAAKVNQYGNIQASQIVQLLSYFRAFGEQGYKANMTTETRDKRAKVKRVKGYKTITGVQYFVAKPGSHLAPGIWAKRGTHGVDVAPVLLFVKRPRYSRYINMADIGTRVLRSTFPRALGARLAAATVGARR